MKIILLGDIAFTGIISEQPEKNIERYKKILPVLNSVDLVFANLEMPVKVDDSKNEYKNFIYYSLPGPTEDLLNLLNIGCVSLANNHINDCKMSGLKATISVLDELKIRHTGAGWKKKHIEPVIIETDGKKLGFLAYVDIKTNPKTENFPELFINYFEIDNVIKDIDSLKKSVNNIIVSIHWGIDYSYYPTSKQIELAHKIVDAGADIIMGHHPHTFQPYEKYQDGYIFYSLGGLTFGDYIKDGKTSLQALFRRTKKSAIVSYDLKDKTVGFIPIKEMKGNYVKIDKRDYEKWSRRRWILYKIKNSSTFTIWLFNFQEKVLYRIYEYFFGYYQNPFKRLLQLSNLRKINRLFEDINNK